MSENSDEKWMLRALSLANEARDNDEVPVGAVVVLNGEIIGEGFNNPVSVTDPSAHAEINALRNAGSRLENYRLPGAALYVTIEPCTMCVGALIHARIERVIFGAREPRAGALFSNLHLHQQSFYNHQLQVTEGILAEDCAALMTDFFRVKRGR